MVLKVSKEEPIKAITYSYNISKIFKNDQNSVSRMSLNPLVENPNNTTVNNECLETPTRDFKGIPNSLFIMSKYFTKWR